MAIPFNLNRRRGLDHKPVIVHQQIPRQQHRANAESQQHQHGHTGGDPSSLRRRQPTKPNPRARLPSPDRSVTIIKIVCKVIA
jgi:hypothetical protein